MKQTRRASSRRRSGFTLLEMLIVVTIIGLIATLVVTNMGDKAGEAKAKITQATIARVDGLVQEFNLDVGRFPTEDEGLEALIRDPGNLEGWDGPYGNRESLPKDGWNRDLVYEVNTEKGWYYIKSLGADGKAGGEGEAADIHNRQ